MTDQSKFQRTTWGSSASSPAEDEFEHTEIWEPTEGEASRLPLMWLFVSQPTASRGAILAVSPDAVLGRGKTAHIQWHDPRISREHARFTLEPDTDAPAPHPLHFYIWPLKAKHGVIVNGEVIRGAKRLKENDEIKLGDTVFVVKILL